ncbi:uracil nucleotide/cysteinyl leukotriene receptor-like [Danio aesculapii]|uniref:uracil nucleotide/cysteinyl leukotriene receptor-like n=1 Tax=Danio aesculapii TaxID=1142201 RepID=UPI0024BF5FDD|nr:uracil nucleotide/cysteinyl leukotriene receptor-like [Danio aesculapii]
MNSTVNFIAFESPTNSTTPVFDLLNILDIFNLLFGLPTHSYVIWLIVTGTESQIASGFFNLNLSVCDLRSFQERTEKANSENMNNSTLNFTHEAPTNSKIQLFGPFDFFLYVSSFLFGLPTHSYVLWLIFTGTGGGVASEFFNINLSVCEIGNCLNVILTFLSLLSSSLNVIADFLKGIAIAGRCMFQCLICVERYLAVVHPVTFLKYKPLRYRLIGSAAIWIIIIVSGLFSMFTSFSNNDLAYRCFFSAQFLVSIFVQLFCLVVVLRALKKSGPGESKREKEENHMKRRAFHLILIITVTMIITYVPYTVIGLSFILTGMFISELLKFSYICFVFAGFVYPLLYLHRVGKLSILSVFCACVN